MPSLRTLVLHLWPFAPRGPQRRQTDRGTVERRLERVRFPLGVPKAATNLYVCKLPSASGGRFEKCWMLAASNDAEAWDALDHAEGVGA